MQRIEIFGYWNDDESNLEKICMVCETPEEECIEDEDDQNIFYYFDHDKPIEGNHGEFTVTTFNFL